MTRTDHRIASALAPLGDGALTAEGIAECVRPLFARVLAAAPGRIYLANHSLGRPLDAMAEDVQEGVAAWYAHMGGAWDAWRAEMDAYRARLARLLGAVREDTVLPKTSAGQGLRAVLNTYDTVPRVVATAGEFDSLDVILREYARRGRIRLDLVEVTADGILDEDRLRAAVVPGTDLVIVSPILFRTGQRLRDLAAVAAAARAVGARVLLDVYHALGVVPLDVAQLDADFAVGGSYKYLRGGPGACFLYVHPRHLDGGLRTLDIGWFAKHDAFSYERPEPPRFASGGDGWLESTPAVLPAYQARAGQVFTLTCGVARLRAWSCLQQQRLLALLADEGVPARGGDAAHGAFITVRDERASTWVQQLAGEGITVDARGAWLRVCPDVLNDDGELVRFARVLGNLARR